MKKIAFLIGGLYHISGISSVTIPLINELSKSKNYDITLISILKKSEMQFSYPNDMVKVITLFNQKVNLKLRLPILIYKLYKHLNSEKYDIIVTPVELYFLFYVFHTKNNLKIYSWNHGDTPLNENKWSLRFYIRKIAYKYSDTVIAITKGAKKTIEKNFSTNTNVIQIYNISNFSSQKHKYNVDSKMMISAGVLEYHKGFDYAIEIGKIIFDKHPDWKWHIYGKGKLKHHLQKKIILNNLENNIILKGETNNILELYKNYSFFVLTSRIEPFGMVIIEAQNSKLPIISFDCPYGPKEIISNKLNGYLIKNFQFKEMANKINFLIENKAIRIRMANNSNKNLYNFSRDYILQKWIRILN